MKKILVDTDILINFVHGFNKKLNHLLQSQSKNKLQLYINPIIIAEYLNNKNLKERKNYPEARAFLSLFNIININQEIGIITGELLREGKIPFIADAFIGVTCLQSGLQLYTNNKKDFKNVKGLKLFSF